MNQTKAIISTSFTPEASRVLRNTYTLLAMTLLTSAATAGLAVTLGVGRGTSLLMSLAALGLIWFVLPRTANSGKGVAVIFAFTALLGASLGPLLSHYLKLQNGPQIVMQALGGTALVFLSLSAYVLMSRKDFSFMGGFLFVGLIVVLVSLLAMAVAGFFGVYISGVYLALNAAIVLLMSGFILFDTSRIIHGGETNYVLATTALYLDIYNLFVSLLQLIGAADD